MLHNTTRNILRKSLMHVYRTDEMSSCKGRTVSWKSRSVTTALETAYMDRLHRNDFRAKWLRMHKPPIQIHKQINIPMQAIDAWVFFMQTMFIFFKLIFFCIWWMPMHGSKNRFVLHLQHPHDHQATLIMHHNFTSYYVSNVAWNQLGITGIDTLLDL